MNNQLYDLLIKAQKKDNDAVMTIIDRFTPLIKKYNRKFRYDDISSELIIAIINAVYYIPKNITEDEEIVAYIAKSVINKYNQLIKKYIKTYNMETELNADIIGKSENNYIEEKIIICDLLDKLPDLQRKIIYEEFFKDCSESDIAKDLHISRQAVNRAKNRALNNMRLHISCQYLTLA